MLYFSLPNFFTNFKFNQKFLRLNRQYPHFFKADIKFTSVHGNFPYCYWNGGFNNSQGKGAFYNDIIECGKLSNLPLRFNFANINLDKTDSYNVMANSILQNNETGSNYIEISNLQLLEYIKEKYPYYKFIFSKEASLLYPFTLDLINQLIDSETFELIELSDNFDLFSDISKPNRIEITVNQLCNCQCESYNQCKIQEHLNQYDYSEKSIYLLCGKRSSYKNLSCKTIEELEQLYVPFGINHFKIESIPLNDLNSFDTILWFINYFIKEEYKKQALSFLC